MLKIARAAKPKRVLVETDASLDWNLNDLRQVESADAWRRTENELHALIRSLLYSHKYSIRYYTNYSGPKTSSSRDLR
jgi:hypothetical protein